MSTPTVVEAPPKLNVHPLTGRTSKWRWRWLGIAALVVAIIVGRWASNGNEENLQSDALRAAEKASIASGKPIGVLSPSAANRWSSATGPVEKSAIDLVKPGNVYLEPIVYMLDPADDPGVRDPDARCYVYAVQRGQTFDAESVTAIMQICYRGTFARPYSTSWMSVAR